MTDSQSPPCFSSRRFSPRERSRSKGSRGFISTLFLATVLVVYSVGAREGYSQVSNESTSVSERSSSVAVDTVATRSLSSAREQLYEALANDAAGAQQSLGHLKRVVKVVSPTVVHIAAQKTQRTPTGAINNVEEAGAGVILRFDDRNYVVTNRHVIVDAKAQDIRIQTSSGQFFYPDEIRTDRDTDLAVLFINKPELSSAKTGDSKTLEVGDFVVAVGSPFGLNHSVSYGIVSALGRRDLELGKGGVKYQDFIQTDAAINPGNSGGPLMNLRGEVIGINTAIASNSGGNDGIGFTTPMNIVKRVAGDLIRHGRVIRGFLGVSLDSNYTPEKARELGFDNVYGARITGVSPESPAGEAGLQIGDIVMQFDGTRVDNDSDLVNKVSLTRIGDSIPIVFFRDGNRMTSKVKIRDRIEFGLAPR